MLAYAYGQWRLGKRCPGRNPEPWPRVSVVVPLRNEESQVAALVQKLLAQDYPDYECILVDDHSTDRTLAGLQACRALDARIRILVAEGNGKKSALLTGVKAARGEYVITTDADCRMEATWLCSMVRTAWDQKADLVIGPVRMEGKPLPALEYLSLSAVTAGSAGIGHPLLCSGANLLVGRETWLRAADRLEWKEAGGDDQFLLGALKVSKARVAYAYTRDALVRTTSPDTIGGFLSQRARWAGKSRRYKDPEMVGAALMVLLTQLVLLVALGWAWVDPYVGGWWLAAALSNMVVLWPAARFFRQERLLCWFPVAQLLYPFYVLAVLVRLLVPNQWKDRTI